MKKTNLFIIITLIVLIAFALIYVLRNTQMSATTQPTTPTTANGGVIELPQDDAMPLENLDIAPSTIPTE